MVLEKLGKSLHSALQKITRSGHVNKKTVKSLVKDIQKGLLQADVNVQMVLDLTKRIEERALEEEVPSGVSRKKEQGTRPISAKREAKEVLDVVDSYEPKEIENLIVFVPQS
ncbi:hypothetical protein AKJ41_01615 [candidate division MSBL1 archaeon SCGC-AAA259O05]|uniref:Signal recognition particle SRP54 helical bundle domain-containing protein n=1 Tax=candidate division MSBL1 archaeon SCGC-AAA259O05 TaxID=1698271 RepID=A0A133V4N9_9EURY|nr:hypothetical protein AKJ41_01615 [candidate division MSBL1 archaeon SCGC-AAA259O05]